MTTIPTLPTINVDLEKKCAECGKGGTVDNGLCLSCTTRAIRGERMRSVTARAVQARWKRQRRSL